MSASSSFTEMTKLYFEEGLPGFSNLQFFQIQQQEKESPFFVLTSLENPTVEFGMIDPFALFPDYEFQLSDLDRESLRIQEESPLVILNIITIRPDGQVTVNLKAPIVVNMDNRKAKQVVLNDDKYTIRHPLFTMGSKVANK